MTDLTTAGLILAALTVAAWAGVSTARDRRLDNALFYGLAVLESLLVIQLAVGLVALGATDKDVESATFVGYLLTSVLILPLAVVWAVAEKSRWGTAVLVVGALTVAALVLRGHQVWTAGG